MTDVAARLESTLSDRYRIERELGAGGMATVYLAEDVRHHRKVAIKVLHPELSAVLGPERFLKEIELTANLQHPHILPLFDSGNADGLLFYVMPYVEGETLRGRLEREQQLPIADALRIASEVADALEYAHRRGVVHRDVKPENILLHDGRPLVADFGIALAVQQAGGARMTQTGMSLGTPQYMAPEQAMGDKSVDHRADIYALGAIAYEMLTGEPPFTGPNSQAIVAKVLTTDPTSLTVKRRSIPPHVEDAVLTALEKMPADRFTSAAEFRAALVEQGSTARAAPPGRQRPAGARAARAVPTWARRPAVVIAAGALLLIAAGAIGWILHSTLAVTAAAEPVRFAFSLARPGIDRSYIAISPDGRRIAQVVGDTGGPARVHIRELGSMQSVPVPGTENPFDPSFSPDGEWISFTAGPAGMLRKVPVRGGPPTDLADSAGTHAWTEDGHIVFSRQGQGIWRVSATGGAAQQLTELDTARREFQHVFPQVLPGSRAMIYTSYATPLARARVEAYDFRSRRKKVLVEGAVFGRYAESGHLLYMRDGAIFAAPFDARAVEVRGDAVPVQDDVAWEPTDGLGAFAVARNGTLVYVRGSEWNVARRLIWKNRSGEESDVLGRSGAFAEPQLSPDGRWIALTITTPKRDVWLYEIARGILSRLTRAEAAAFNPVWAPDSRSIVYVHENPVYDINRMPIDGSAASREVITSRWDKAPSSISPDGRLLAYSEIPPDGSVIQIVPLNGGDTARRLPVGGVPQGRAMFSPSGRWIAYEESTDGRTNVYVTSADGSGGRRQVSPAGGGQPRWTKGGRELVYRRGETILAAPVDPETGDVGTPVELFRQATYTLALGSFGYDVTPDGSRFLLAVRVPRPEAQPVVVVLNWFEELKARTTR
ncbi:MAG TPA: protein kinase [Gemmatimonadaceae bacterium]|nr:protein kinase [Gemmatimonadaceae bacterium]